MADKTFIIELSDEERAEGSRFDRKLLAELQKARPSTSRNELKSWFAEGRILLDDREVAPSFLLKAPRSEARVRTWDESGISAQPSTHGCFLSVLYEDATLLALNKRSGVPSVPHSSEETETALGAALALRPGLSSVGLASGARALEPSILHRLDTGTSGVILFAKEEADYARLRGAWSGREVRKLYRAIVSLKSPGPLKLPLVIDTQLAHDSKSSRRMIVLRPTTRESAYRGKPLPALSRILGMDPLADGRFDVTIEIETGVMHQIRCHLASLGAPIEGDLVYGGGSAQRLFLHAWKLTVPTVNGAEVTIEAPLPVDWPV